MFGDALAVGTAIPMVPQFQALDDALAVTISKVMSHQGSVESALADLQTTMEGIMAKT